MQIIVVVFYFYFFKLPTWSKNVFNYPRNRVLELLASDFNITYMAWHVSIADDCISRHHFVGKRRESLVHCRKSNGQRQFFEKTILKKHKPIVQTVIKPFVVLTSQKLKQNTTVKQLLNGSNHSEANQLAHFQSCKLSEWQKYLKNHKDLPS